MRTQSYDANQLLESVKKAKGVCFSELIAEVTLWAAPEVHYELVSTGSTAWFPGIRRKRGKEETKGTKDGVTLDDNTKANQAIKYAVGGAIGIFDSFEACHIYPKTCYNVLYHTTIANLVLIPRAIAGFSDHDEGVRAALQYRSYELYGWHPSEASPPLKPFGYPSKWRIPEPFSEAVKRKLSNRKVESGHLPSLTPACESKSFLTTANFQDEMSIDQSYALSAADPEISEMMNRVCRWARSPSQVCHKIIALVYLNQSRCISKNTLMQQVSLFSKNPAGAISSMQTSKGNAYGFILIQSSAGMIRIRPELENVVASLRWHSPLQ